MLTWRVPVHSCTPNSTIATIIHKSPYLWENLKLLKQSASTFSKSRPLTVHTLSVYELIIAPSGDNMVECIWKWISCSSSRSSSRFLVCISISTCHSDLMGGEAWKPALSFPQPQGQNGVVIFSVMEGETVGGSGGGATTQRDGNSEPNRSFPLWLPLEQRVCQEKKDEKKKKKRGKKVNVGLQQADYVVMRLGLWVKDNMQRHPGNVIAWGSEFNHGDTMTRSRCLNRKSLRALIDGAILILWTLSIPTDVINLFVCLFIY